MARWEGIFEFVQVVEHASFTKAAEAMGMSTSRVSKLVARLEDRLKSRLLLRTTRTLKLTDEGEQFYKRCKLAIDSFERAEEDIAQNRNEPRGRLKVNLSGSFQDRFIVPILAEFTKRYRHLHLQVDCSDRRADLLGGGYDLLICPGELESSSLVARKLADNFNYLVASPDYLEHAGDPMRLDQLSDHNCLIGEQPVWYLSNGEDTVQLRPEGNWQSDNGAALLSAARAGLGIAQLPFFAVQSDIEAGRLIQLLPDWSKYPEPVWIMYARQRHVPIKIRLLIDYLVDQLQHIQL